MDNNKEHVCSQHWEDGWEHFESFDIFVSDVINDAVEFCALQDWEIDYECVDFSKMSIHEDYSSGRDDSPLASIEVERTYLRATIRFDKDVKRYWESGRQKELQHCIVHELCHLFTGELSVMAAEACPPNRRKELIRVHEQTTERIARIVLRGLPKLEKREPKSELVVTDKVVPGPILGKLLGETTLYG